MKRFFQYTRTASLPLAIVAAVLVASGLITGDGSTYSLRLATTLAMYVALAYSWNLIGGLAGYPAFSTAAFFGLGAYIGGILQISGVSLGSAAVAAGAGTGLFAAVLGLILLHLRGHYFAIATVVIAEVLREIILNAPNVTGGGMGLNLPLLQGSVLDQAQMYFGAMTVCAFAAFATNILVVRSRIGFALNCIAQNEAAAATLGINARKFKVIAFTLSSVFPGIAGAIYASWVNYIDPTDVFDIGLSVKPIIMALLGGAGTLAGPLLGALSFVAVEEVVWRNLLNFHSGMLGVLIVLLVIWLPGGVISIWHGVVHRRKGGLQ
ncbi:branched-chain amino acid ABC transporter permease [Noviherbaspirillum cavernae]|uniref:Branched-chain amino acid ABC transporter permease n=1 Tax=Noviherbaspirillum cavernae TaxID=2320862 RepID=A0A418WX58_9BURK|nr:branched-chain amino acid ABC transporter permease [Noviherbaspirillum cavernae]RJG04781.1 branched-chain amino acid ABC transporter permease [Noviherbaspirillum cavernae]